MKDELPIITIGVLSYNSEKTIIDTLNSIYDQTYKNLALVISDDGSVDDSKILINSWLEEKGRRFIKIKFLNQAINKGITKNFDILMNNTFSKWMKFIAADDLLMPKCIEENYNYIIYHNIDTILYSVCVPFSDINGYRAQKVDMYQKEYIKKVCLLNAHEQYLKLLKNDFIFSPTGFINTHLYKKLGGLNCKVKNIEDWPLRLLFTQKGYKIWFMDKKTVYYRISNSISNSRDTFFKEEHIKQVECLKKELVYPNISKKELLYYLNEYLTRLKYFLIIKIFKNRINFITKFINYFFMIFDSNKWKKIIYELIGGLRCK